jgi:hypothetical protein
MVSLLSIFVAGYLTAHSLESLERKNYIEAIIPAILAIVLVSLAV